MFVFVLFLVGIDDDSIADRSSDKLQSAICYAIDGDQVEILELLMQQTEGHWLSWQQKRPLLHIACERGAWNCVKYLVAERSDEINQCYDEYYPIHQAALQPIKFLELLIQNEADVKVCTATQQLTLLHLVFLLGRKSTEDTLNTCKLLLYHGLRELINKPDSLGNTPLHGLIVRYALEEARYGYDSDIQPWNKWDVLHIARYLLRNGASPSINQAGNSALACVLRHVRDWEFRYEMLNMLLQAGGNPNIVGRDGSVPLMVCLVPLINKDPLHHFTHTMKVCYLNCVRILLKHGANPNCSSRSNLTPLHVLVFSANETMALGKDAEQNMEFVRSLLVLLLQHGLDTNIRISQRTQHILQALLDMVQGSRLPSDLKQVYNFTLTFLQYGANPDLSVSSSSKCETSVASSIFLRSAGNHPILYHYAIMVSRKDDLMSDCEQRFASLFWLYYLSMSHKEVYLTLGALLRAMEAGVIPVRATALCSLIKELYSKPRTLKQIVRHVIYKSMDCKPGLYVNKLPLPNSLKDYLLNFDP
uniref:SOCS box domain-containing protein n=1 Tax=Clastoptera arizonana TaxID=38151 RepID=A0A1B6E5F5_9HEMI